MIDDRININTEGGDYEEVNNHGQYAKGDIHNNYQQTPAKLRDSSEAKLLAAVKNEVAGRLAQSLHNRVYIELHKEEDPSQVIQPWAVDVKLGSQPSERCPEGTNIVDIFDKPEISGRLLILGAPGSGKTMMLLQLAEELVQRAGANAAHLVPVLLNLSAWKPEFKDIPSWMVADLKLKYGVRQDIAKKWLDEGRILPLLDGLDELMSERQETCVGALNDFLPAWSGVPLVVCSRREEYQNYEANLGLNGAVILQPLTDGQIEKFLRGAGCEWLWEALQKDGLVQSPLLLKETFWDADLKLLEPVRDELNKMWDYLNTMGKEELKAAFSYEMFEIIERYLNREEKVSFRRLWTRFRSDEVGLARSPLFLTILVLASSGLPGELWQKEESAEERRWVLFEAYIGEQLKRGYVGRKNLPATKHGQKPYKDDEKTKAWLGWLALRLIQENQTEFFIEKLQPRFLATRWQKSIYGLTSGLFFGLFFGLFSDLVQGLVSISRLPNDMVYKVIFGIFNALFYGIFNALFYGIFNALFYGMLGWVIGWYFGSIWTILNIKTFETIEISWHKVLRKLPAYPFYIAVFMLILGLAYGFVLGLIAIMVLGIIELFTGADIDTKTKDNQGINQSISNSVILGFICFPFSILIPMILYYFNRQLSLDAMLIQAVGWSCLFSTLLGGLGIAILHYSLRITLWLFSYSPLNYSKFLRYCTERGFLQRVGGGYRFVHALLRDHFAAQYTPK